MLFYLGSQSSDVIRPFELHDSDRIQNDFGIYAGTGIRSTLPLFIAPLIALGIGIVSRQKPHSSCPVLADSAALERLRPRRHGHCEGVRSSAKACVRVALVLPADDIDWAAVSSTRLCTPCSVGSPRSE
ncbi:hypothetical protein [Streptomyces sp. NPDC048650]|uniref:hypothetical protein n=1 Tax=Streptomyces sp. NPDC048650 TaxID=3365583 RepID=UPI0037168DE4